MDPRNRRERHLTDLEAVTIAYILRRSLCTAYQVRRSFEKSTTAKFSSSSGSIYPLIRRLYERGYLIVADKPSDRRGAQQISVTSIGREKVRKWITGLGDPKSVGIYDPIRSRLLNLSLLPKKEQIRCVEAMLDLLERQKITFQEYEEQVFVGDERLYEISREATRQENALRLSWLKRVLNTLTEKPE